MKQALHFVGKVRIASSRRIVGVRERGLSILLISRNTPHVFEITDRIHVHRLGRRAAVLSPRDVTMSDTVAIMTGPMQPSRLAQAA